MAKKRWKQIRKELLHKYRVVLVDTQTFAERFSFTLSGFNVFLAAGTTVVVLVGMTLLLIAYTPLREYIPGYASTKLRREALHLSTQVDSLESVVNYHEKQWSAVRRLLTNEPLPDSVVSEAPSAQADPNKLKPTASEQKFREQQEVQDQYRLTRRPNVQVRASLIPPVAGTLVEKYAPARGHLGVGWSVSSGTTIKCALDGTVVQADWSPDLGHFLWVQHANNTLTFYSQNAQVLKKRGARVRAGEALAISGKGLRNASAAVHFELWMNGQPVNPLVYLP
ncbi:MAG: M23 family metallopeptidase [Schleiferiaceae bacterium]|nr:M23 family metallopeptidase [Schleiferiaceae bacterium]